jgi:YidC/Oxa1 family membrane protein insertase
VDKRFLSFLWSALLLVLVYTTFQQMIIKPKPPAPAQNVENVPDGEEQAAAPPADQIKGDIPQQDTDLDGSPVPPKDGSALAGGEKAQAAELSADLELPRRYTLGSLDPETGHAMLVILSNQGGTVERVELNGKKYTDVDDTSGYLGELGFEDHPEGGCRITVVGPGTPAALATCDSTGTSGLRGPTFQKTDSGELAVSLEGDILRGINDEVIENAADFNRIMARTRPGQTVRLEVRRSQLSSDNESSKKDLEFSAKLRRRPVAVLQPEPFLIEGDQTPDPLSFPMTLHQIGDTKLSVAATEIDKLPSLRTGIWKSEGLQSARGDGSLVAVEFHYPLGPDQLALIGVKDGNVELVKRYRLRQPEGEPDEDSALKNKSVQRSLPYELILELELRNVGSTPIQLAYSLDGPSGLPLEGWWYSLKVHPSRFGAAGIRDIVYRSRGSRHEMVTCPAITQYADANPKSPAKPLAADANGAIEMQYIGTDAQFFSAVLMPQPGEGAADPFASIRGYTFQAASALAIGELDKKQKKRTNVSFRLVSSPELVPPQSALRHRFAIFAGPKDPELLEPIGLGECIVYGWFKIVARPMVNILHGLYWLSGSFSYGIAIVLLTVLVRGAMYPLGRKMALNAQKMQELAPELKKIADQYKEDMEKRANAQRELFRKHKYNPLSGCFVMFFQLPVFVGLYRALSVDIRLRQAPLLPGVSWCSNLAGPDRLWHWENTFLPAAITSPTGFMGPFLNILPFFSFALMMVHQKMFTPPPQDEQQRMQMQIMNIMMVFFAVMFHKVAAGLCIYFIVSSLWGLGERLLLGKYKQPAVPAAIVKSPAKSPAP